MSAEKNEKSPYISVSHNSESSSGSDKGPSMPTLSIHDYSDHMTLNSPSDSSLPPSERIQNSKKLSHFSDVKRASETALSMNFLKVGNLKGDDTEHITIEFPQIIQTNAPELQTSEDVTQTNENPIRSYKRALTIKAQNNYFVSENSLEQENMNFGEIIENDLNFNYKIFFEFFIMHSLFYFILGPIAVIPIYMIWGANLAKNQFFYGFNSEFFFQTVEFLGIFCVIFLYYFYTFTNVYMIEIYMIFAAVLLRIAIISIKYATMNEDKIRLLKTQEISHEYLKNEFTLRHFKEINDIELEKELQTTIIRKDIDVALLLFRFLGELSPDIQAQIQSDYNPFQVEREKTILDQKQKRLSSQSSNKASLLSINSGNSNNNILSPSLTKKNLTVNSTTTPGTSYNSFLNSSKVGKRMNLYNDFIDDDLKTTVYSGYLLAKLIIKAGYKNGFNATWFLVLGLIISFIHAAIPSCFRLYSKNYLLGDGFLESFMIIALFLVNFYLFFLNISFLLFGIFEFERQVRCLNQLSNLMASKKMVSCTDEKFTPTIDFFCKLSLKSWGSLHKIIRGFGAKYKLRIECYLTLFSLFYLIVTILVISAIFGNLASLYSFINLIILIYEVLIMSLCMIALISIGVAINKQYQIHKGLIKTNKDVISDLLRLYMVYFDKKEYTPQNEIYKKGVEKIIQNVDYYLMNNISICNTKKWVHDELKKKVTKRVLKDLICICDEIIEELTFENMYEPFRINGIAATPKVLHSIFAIFGSLLFAVGQKYINNLIN